MVMRCWPSIRSLTTPAASGPSPRCVAAIQTESATRACADAAVPFVDVGRGGALEVEYYMSVKTMAVPVCLWNRWLLLRCAGFDVGKSQV